MTKSMISNHALISRNSLGLEWTTATRTLRLDIGWGVGLKRLRELTRIYASPIYLTAARPRFVLTGICAIANLRFGRYFFV